MTYLNFSARVVLAFTIVVLPQIILPNLGGSGLMLHFNILVWIGLSGFMGLAVYRALSFGEVTLPPSWSLLLLALCLFLLPSIYEGLDLTYLGVGAAGFGFGLFFLSLFQFQDVVTSRFVVTLIIATGVLQALIGLAQLNGIAAGLDGAIEVAGASNPIGSFQQRNLFGSYVSTGMLALAVAALYSGVSASYRGLMWFGVACMGLLVALSLSRSAWLATILSFGMLVLIVRPKLSLRSLLFGVALFASVIFAASLAIEDLGSLAVNILSRLASADEPRLVMYRHAIDMIKDNPWIGYGRGDFESAYMHYTAAQNYLDPNYPGAVLTNIVHPHNELLYWWVEGGILPVIAVMILLFVMGRVFFRGETRERAYFVLLVPIATHAMLEQPFLHSFAHVAVMVLVLYLVLSLAGQQSNKVVRWKPRVWTAFLAGFITFLLPTLYMINAFHNVIVLTLFNERPAKHSDLLKNIVYPANQNTALNYVVYTNLMNYALVHKDEKRAQMFFAWAEQELAYRPRLELIKNLSYSYQYFGYEQEAKRTASLLTYYFSDSKQLYTDQVVFEDVSTE